MSDISIQTSGKIKTDRDELGVASATEIYGGGDTLFSVDTSLVENIYGSLKTNAVDTKAETDYWLVSRFYNYYADNCVSWTVPKIESGILSSMKGQLYSISAACGGKDGDHTNTASLRPILTLKGDISPISGDGKTLSTAWTFE